ncbi:MAG: hypothetical protein ACPG3V_09085 [Porticoccaceae bacterium]
MKRFEVWVTETIEYRVEVDAADSESALREAEEEVTSYPAARDELRALEIEARYAKEIDDD